MIIVIIIIVDPDGVGPEAVVLAGHVLELSVL